ncbi:hypothetical protein [Polyangium jinanense]|uniref:Uncharacterized protein n=1 Tax=Polyangium jinanense TaxID=2829994 RepID=A0A9X3X983_9BACT|nr:hypothetical protein [Polyangium jinanense]MDC3962513.1 hypothetical protein [Polyangium jinanense]MDC3986069.1 hypothetical protein [Polyangium jinanense]
MSGWTKRGALVVATMGALSTIGIASCALTDYQPPTANTTSSTGGAGGTGGTGGMPGPGGPGGMGGTGGMPGPGGPGGGGGEACGEASQCLPAVPFKDGWMGPYWGMPTNWQKNAGACPDNSLPEILYADPSKPECLPCECTINPGATCVGAKLSCWADGCEMGTPTTYDNGCISGGNMPGVLLLGSSDCKVTGTYGVVAADNQKPCSASGGTLVNGNAWEMNVHLCPIAATSACDSGGACVTVPTGNYSDYACIKKVGAETACPTGWEFSKVAYEQFDDQRSCPGCGCVGSELYCDASNAFKKTGAGCGSAGSSITSCTAFNSLEAANIVPPKVTAGEGFCPAAQPQGEVHTSGPTTICCHQLF